MFQQSMIMAFVFFLDNHEIMDETFRFKDENNSASTIFDLKFSSHILIHYTSWKLAKLFLKEVKPSLNNKMFLKNFR